MVVEGGVLWQQWMGSRQAGGSVASCSVTLGTICLCVYRMRHITQPPSATSPTLPLQAPAQSICARFQDHLAV